MRGHVTRKAGSKKWYFVLDMYDDNGKRHRKWFSGYDTKKEAEKALAAKIHELETGSYVLPTKETVDSYFRRWLDDKKSQVRYGTYRKYAWLVNSHIIPHLGHIELSKLKPAQVQRFYTNLRDEDQLSNRSVLHIHRLLHSGFERAVKWGLISRNVIDAVETPRAEKYHASIWNAQQVVTFLDAVDRAEPHYAIIFVLALQTGMRQAEILGLRWSDIDFSNNTLSVQRTQTYVKKKSEIGEVKKDKSRRSIALSADTIAALKKHRVIQAEQKLFFGPDYQDSDMVVTTLDGRPLSQNTLSTVWYRLLDQVDVPRIRFHDLRHTHASLLLQQNVNPKIVSERLGHANINITLDTYSHVLPTLQQDAANKLDELFRTSTKSSTAQ